MKIGTFLNNGPLDGCFLNIRESSIAELEAAPNIQEILNEYAAESSIAGLPPPSAKVELYKYMESKGGLHVIAAFLDELLIGYINVLCPVNAHYGIVIAVSESFFVLRSHRKTGAGLKLLKAAEEYAKQISPGLLVSAGYGSNLAEILPGRNYKKTNEVFFKCFK